jgi:4-aminobutyrate aminotransferase/(S)-3-amino-2-methylpropionate transaminase
MDSVIPGTIGGTYCGNALACASALKVIEIIERDRLCERALVIAEKCNKKFNDLKEKYPVVGDVRGIGVMMGIEFIKDKTTKEPNKELVGALVQECVKNGLIIESAGTYDNVVRFLCPLVVTDEQLEAGFTILENAIIKLTSM